MAALRDEKKDHLIVLTKSAGLIKELVDKSLHPLHKSAAEMWTILENEFQHISPMSVTRIFMDACSVRLSDYKDVIDQIEGEYPSNQQDVSSEDLLLNAEDPAVLLATKVHSANAADLNQFVCSTQVDIKEPETYERAIQGPNAAQWAKAIEEELDQLHKNDT